MSPHCYSVSAAEIPPLPQQPGIAFRPTRGFPGYAVGTDGSVWSSKRGGRWKRLATAKSQDGYWLVNLWRDNKMYQFKTAWLVLGAFVEPRPPGLQCRHLDGNKDNNTPGNLAWGTVQENADDRVRHGTILKGGKNRRALLSDSQAEELMKRLAAGEGKAQLAREYGLRLSAVYAIDNGTNWHHIPSPTGSYPISPDMRKSPLRKKGARPRGYKLRLTNEEREARRQRAHHMRKFKGQPQNAAETVPPPVVLAPEISGNRGESPETMDTPERGGKKAKKGERKGKSKDASD